MRLAPTTRMLFLIVCLLAGGLPLRAEWGTLSEMHHYHECFGLNPKTKPDFAVTMLSSTAPGNVFHEGEQPQFTFQLQNLSDQPVKTTARVDVIRYTQPTFSGDQWYPDLVRLETLEPATVAVDLGPGQWTNLTISPRTQETRGGYGLVVDLGPYGRAYLTSYVRTFHLLDAYGNTVRSVGGQIQVPLDETGHFLRANPQVKRSFEDLLAAIRSARVEGLEPLEIVAYDFTSPIDRHPTLRLRLTSQHNQPFRGCLTVSVGDLAAPGAGNAVQALLSAATYKHALEGAVRDGQLTIHYEAGWRIVECVIPWYEGGVK